MQQQNQKTHHERKRQYVKSRADEPLEKPDQQRQKRTLDAKAAQHQYTAPAPDTRPRRPRAGWASVSSPWTLRLFGTAPFRLPEDFPVDLPPEARFFVCFSATRLRPFRKSGTAAASQAPRPSNNSKSRRIFRVGRPAAENRWQSSPTRTRRPRRPDTSAHSSTPRPSKIL